MSNLASDNVNKISGLSHDFKNKDQISDHYPEKVVKNAGERVGAMASNISGMASEYVKTGREYVKTNPAKGVAIAAATGVAAGFLLSLALRKNK